MGWRISVSAKGWRTSSIAFLRLTGLCFLFQLSNQKPTKRISSKIRLRVGKRMGALSMAPKVTCTPPCPKDFARRKALRPPTEFNARAKPLPLVHSFARFGTSSLSIHTSPAPNSMSSILLSSLRTRLINLTPIFLANWTTERPTAELPAFWITKSPSLRYSKSLSNRQAVSGLRIEIASWS